MENTIQVVNIEDKQKILLYLFKAFHDLCEENRLIYNSFGGTMLGAIRHKGFIPWDDDIDVTMPRKDYEKLVNIIKTKGHPILTVHCYPDDNYIYPYAKVGLKNTLQYENVVKSPFDKLTINMDIFPVDGYPDNEIEIDEYCSLEDSIILCTYKTPKMLLIKHPVRFLKKIYSQKKGYKFWINKQISLATKNDVENHSNLICNGAGWGRRGIIKKEAYFDRTLYDFENIKVWGIRNYEQHMSNLYGNYMQLPPENKRVLPHDDKVFISKKLYEEIIRDIGGKQ